ncbi:MAG TPA: hypothetical protein VJU78_15255, partial [Chitinophagaceae bacterium]|nr:hypothetical protein [Chitinophagaceae bacterium]
MCIRGKIFVTVGLTIIFFSCNNEKDQTTSAVNKDSIHSCMNIPARFGDNDTIDSIKATGDTSTAGMKYIPGGTFMMGGDNDQASEDEFPKHSVQLDGFWM